VLEANGVIVGVRGGAVSVMGHGMLLTFGSQRL
jgi:hypothetical protein